MIEPKASVDELMKLIAKLNGWSDQSSRVTMGYMPARVHTAQDESHLDYKNWGWVVHTTICGMDKLEVDAQGKTLEQALWLLAQAIPKKMQEVAIKYNGRFLEANKHIETFFVEQSQRQ